MAEPAELEELLNVRIWIDFPPNMTPPWVAPYVAAGHYSLAYGDARVKCEVVHPNGTTYTRGPFQVTGGTWSTQFTTLPATPPGKPATLTAHLYNADGSSEVSDPYSIFVVIV